MELKQLEMQDILLNGFQIDEAFVLNEKSTFGNDFWDFTDSSNIRKNSVDNSKLQFDWKRISERIGNEYGNELKILVFFLIYVPAIFGKPRNYKINTIHGNIMKFVNTIEEIQLEYFKSTKINSIKIFENCGDIKLKDFQSISISPTTINSLKQVLKYLANPIVQKHLSQPISWNESDIKNLKLFPKSKNTMKENATNPLDEKLYLELIKEFTTDIIGFKKAMGLKVESSITSNMQDIITNKNYYYDVALAFEDYILIRETERTNALKSRKRYNTTGKQRCLFLKQYQIATSQFYCDLLKIQKACILAILTFTGIRYSELISFKNNCVIRRKDIYLIKGTITKQKDNLLPTDEEEWVAIPIVRDAIDILNQFQRFNFNSYLVSSLSSVYLNQKELPLSLGAISDGLNFYFEKSASNNDILKEFFGKAEHKITVHRLRHTLAQQLVRGKLGLPYISYHLKHVNSAVVAYNRVSNVTLGYGGISKEITNSVKHYHAAKKELINEIYHPDSTVAGGRNATEFTKRKKEYFQGLMVSDLEIDGIIEDLKSQSLPFLDVGLGYCAGKKEIELKDGTKSPPPCIGQLKCNPVDCGNAVIPKSKLPIWKKVYEDTFDKIACEDYSYMKPELTETLKRAEYVINHFRENEGGILDAKDTY